MHNLRIECLEIYRYLNSSMERWHNTCTSHNIYYIYHKISYTPNYLRGFDNQLVTIRIPLSLLFLDTKPQTANLKCSLENRCCEKTCSLLVCFALVNRQLALSESVLRFSKVTLFQRDKSWRSHLRFNDGE